MSSDTMISVEGVSKKFCRSLKRTMVYGIADVAFDMIGLRPPVDDLRNDEFWALKDVSFEVKRGECVGIIGANGAGKSTLLKLLNGITLPDTGTIKVSGRVGALLELGAGFHPMLTGRENIRLSAAILGLSEAEIARRMDAIVDFSGVETFIDSPVKYYSSGMYVRLGFAIAAHADPDILLIDEALAVGDAFFQSRCFERIRDFKERGTTILFVAHNLDLVTLHCGRALLFEKGQLIADDRPKKVVDHYNRNTLGKNGKKVTPSGQEMAFNKPCQFLDSQWRQCFALNPNEDRYGNKKAEILEAGIFSLNGDPVQVLECHQHYMIKIKVRHNEAMPAAIVAYSIKSPQGIVLCGTNTLYQGIEMGRMKAGEIVVITFRQEIPLNPGQYLLCVGVSNFEEGEYLVYDRRFDYMSFEVVGAQQQIGIFDANSIVEWERALANVD
jgi:teichoic acid transport system ATP-binding protein